MSVQSLKYFFVVLCILFHCVKVVKDLMTFQIRLLQDAQGDNTRSRQEQEEKLILTAWQSMVSTRGTEILITVSPETTNFS